MSRNGWKRDWCHLTSVEEMTAEAIQYLRANEPPEGYFVGFSGGKDSIVTLKRCQLAGVKHTAYYSCTRIDPPEVVKFIKKHYPDVVWLFPKESFWSAIKRKAPPLRNQRWCCDLLKKEPAKDIPLRVRIMGVRAEESAKRAGRPRSDRSKKYNVTFIKPIFYWKEWHVWELIEAHRLAYPDLYNEGFERIGCVVCPMMMHKNQAKVKMHRDRWPGMWKAFDHAIGEWFDKKRNESPEWRGHAAKEEYKAAYYRGFE